MPLEVATFITELQQTNPLSTDKKKQGDDHLTLIKRVLQNTFPDASREFYFPRAQSKTASFGIVKADQNDTFVVSSVTVGVQVNATLPALTGTDDGWVCHFMKFGPGMFFIFPSSGNVVSNGLAVAYARRCIVGAKITAVWAQGQWFITRALEAPMGTVFDYGVPTNGAPIGYEFANGQTLSGGLYPEYVATVGSGLTPDLRGRAVYGREGMGGTAHTGRLTYIDGTAVWNAGGQDTISWGRQYMPNENLTVSLAAGQGNHHHGGIPVTNNVNTQGPVVGSIGGYVSGTGDSGDATLPAMSGALAINGNQTQQAEPNLPPAFVLNKLIVVE
jgi:hypothetical protein